VSIKHTVLPGVVEVFDSKPHHTFKSSALRTQATAVVKT